MPKVARTEPNTTIHYGEAVFEFGDDGTRQVSEQEIFLLERYTANGGPAKITIENKKGGK